MNISSAFDLETRALLHDGIARFSRTPHADGAWTHLKDNGWLALGMPEETGGSGAAIGDLVPLMRAAGAGLWREPLIESLGLACGALLAAAPSSARDRLLTQISEGTALIAMAGAPADTSPPSVRALRRDENVWVLTGHISPAVDGRAWDTILVNAVCDQGVGVFAVDAKAPGILCHDAAVIDGRPATAFVFKETAAMPLAAQGHVSGGHVLAAARRRGHVLAAAEAAGIAHAARDATVSYLALRKQFNQPIIQFQAIRHRLVEMHIRACELDAMLEMACVAYDKADPHLDVLLLRLRAQSAAAATWIAQQAIQLHGGMGMTQELPIGAYYKRALFIDSLFGSHADAVGRLSMAVDLTVNFSKTDPKKERTREA